MARPLRIQFPGALYHVVARGNHGQPIFKDDQDRMQWLQTLGEACDKTGWRIHAYVLMANHYHLLLETPEANLVGGMKWLQSTYTLRYNGRHQVFGHLFQGRYQAILVDGQGGLYWQVVSTYIHLNPARAGLIKVGRERLKAYRWSSFPHYLKDASQGPAWLCRERVLASVGRDGRSPRGYEAYLESRVLELRIKAQRKELEQQWKSLRRGWYVGDQDFRAELARRLKRAMKGRRRESHSGPAKAAHDEVAAEVLLRAALKVLGLKAEAVGKLAKGAPEKLVLAWWLRRRTTVSLRWVSARLGMGHYSRVAQAVSRLERRPPRKLEHLRRQLLELSKT